MIYFYFATSFVIAITAFLYIGYRTKEMSFLTFIESLSIGFLFPFIFVSLAGLVLWNIVIKSIQFFCDGKSKNTKCFSVFEQ